MGSKTFLFFCISLAVVLVITSEVAARELTETSTSVDNSKTVDKMTEGLAEKSNRVDQWGGGGGGGRGGGGGGGGWRGGGGGGGGGWRGGGGHCNCCGYSYCRCCSYPGQAVDAEPHN